MTQRDPAGSFDASFGPSFGVRLLCGTALATVGLIVLRPSAALAACDNVSPATGQTVTCDTAAPNPTTTNIKAAAGSTNVTVNIGAGSTLDVTRATNPTVTEVDTGSRITNSGTILLSGGGGSGLNRGAGMVGINDNNTLTNAAGGVITTTGAFNDGMAANGNGNSLINNGAITTSGPNAYGMTAAWGQANQGASDNTLTNNGTVTTNGSNARAASILGPNGVIINTNTLTTNGATSTAAYMQGNNQRLTNSGTIHATGAGSFAVDSNTLPGFNATIENKSGGQIISDQGTAIRTLNGPTSITSAGLISGGGGIAIQGGNGNVTLTLQTGSKIVGLADGGKGANVVHLEGSGTADNAFANFQTLYMEGTDWTWSGSGDFHDTFITSGSLRLQSSLTGNVSIAAGTRLLAGDGFNPSITPYAGGPAITVTNAGTIDLTNGGSPAANSLTIAGNYTGQNGNLVLRTVLAGDGAASDKLVISGGAATGTTNVSVINAGGGGALTTADGIMVVETTNGGTTTASAFALNGGSVSAGAYQYFLFRGGVSAGTEDNFYLRSTIVSEPVGEPSPEPAPGTPDLPPPPPPGGAPIVLYRPEVAIYSAVPLMARQVGLATLGTFHERQGEQGLLGGNKPLSAAWGRVFGEHTSQRWSGAVNPEFNGSIAGFQAGLDVVGVDSGNGHRDRLGFFVGYARADGNIRGFATGFQRLPVGKLRIDGTSVGAYWTHIGPSGWYVDAVLMNTWYSTDPSSYRGYSAGGNGTGLTASLESGYPIALGGGLTLEPQGQLIWQRLSLDATRDAVSTVDYQNGNAFSGRLGLRLQGNWLMGGTSVQPYLKASYWRDFAGTDNVVFDNVDVIPTQRGANAAEFGGGLVVKVSQAASLYATGDYTAGLGNDHRRGVKGNVGLRISW